MKSAPFEYVRAQSLLEVCQLLSDTTIESRVIAGGQTLVPLMAMRLARPDRIIDIAHLGELNEIVLTANSVRIGACVRQRVAERSNIVDEHLPLLAKALPNVGHQQTRNRGTIGGSLCNADPTAEIALTAMTLEATLNLRSTNGERSILISDFLVDAMETSIADEEFLVSVDFPTATDPHTGCGFVEVNARASDYAIVAAAVTLTLDNEQNRCTQISACVGGASPTPVRASATEKALTGSSLSNDEIKSAAATISNTLNPTGDVHASAMYRKRVAAELLARAIADARDDVHNDVRGNSQ